jgi:hypothetical protein
VGKRCRGSWCLLSGGRSVFQESAGARYLVGVGVVVSLHCPLGIEGRLSGSCDSVCLFLGKRHFVCTAGEKLTSRQVRQVEQENKSKA